MFEAALRNISCFRRIFKHNDNRITQITTSPFRYRDHISDMRRVIKFTKLDMLSPNQIN